MTTARDKLVTVLIPAYNEEATIGQVVSDCLNLNPKCAVVVVDNNSSDRTAKVAKQAGAMAVFCREQGKGYAIRKGINYVFTPYVVMIDADGTYPVSEIPFMMGYMMTWDVVVGCRTHIEDGAMSRTNRLGNYLLTRLAEILYLKRVGDVCSGMWAFNTDTLKKFALESTGFTLEAELFINACKSGCSIKRYPIAYKARPDGSMSKLRFSDGLKIGWLLIRRRFS